VADADLTETATSVAPARRVERWRVTVTRGPAAGASMTVEGAGIVVGSARDADLVIRDPKVSRHHLQLAVEGGVLVARDLESKNGTYFAGSRVDTLALPIDGGSLDLGDSAIAFAADADVDPLRPSPRDRCGRLIGGSAAMRLLYAQIERIAQRATTVLIAGETGSGKELVAEAIHELGPRRDRPFVVLDCGAVAPSLIESELFGHVKGAFTGATSDHKGAFAQADGGTLLLDEIGELDLALQPKLLRVLETQTVRPLGAEQPATHDVRVTAASHRDLDEAVRAGRFRQDLYYRLAVVRLEVPPLRARLDDLPALVAHFLARMGAPPLDAASMAVLAGHAWPGNVRQLRNVLEHAVALAGAGAPTIRAADLATPAALATPSDLLTLPYKEAKGKMVDHFTRDYLEALLARHGGNVSAAAREARLDRNWLVALARRNGLRVRD
jgi:DNA-binding NtrC family response regulator